MITVLKNIIGLVVLVGIIYFVSNYYGLAQQTVGVKGASTDKAQEISKDLQSDVEKQAEKAADSASAVTVGDIIGFIGRFQKIPEDIQNSKEYLQGQIESFTNREK